MPNILVVDDSATMRRMVMSSLRGLNAAHFEEAGSGLEALERLAITAVDLIVLDLNMPDMHGLEVLRFVRDHGRYHDIPIIVLTTRGDDESRSAAIITGASDYVTKPFTPQTLATHARALLEPA